MNCMIMKMKNAWPPMRGSSSGQNVLSQPSLAEQDVLRHHLDLDRQHQRDQHHREPDCGPTKRSRAKPYAVSAEAQTVSIVPKPEYSSELRKNVRNEMPPNPAQPCT